MKRLIGEVVEGAREGFASWGEAMETDDRLTDQEAVQRYLHEHRGNFAATLNFVSRNKPPDMSDTEAAIQYERAMEDELRRKDYA